MALVLCKECGEQVSELAASCPHCGYVMKPATVAASEPVVEAATSSKVLEPAPKNWLIESILVTFFCCMPFGVVGIVNASKVESRWLAGDKEGALRTAKTAKLWTLVALIAGVLIIVGYGLVVLFSVLSGMDF